MPNKNFLLLSMEDAKIKKISNVISNESCRKILDFLSAKEATESELAEKLVIPISTVHYNLQQLTGAGLVSADEFHYSKKGKEVSHYKLANKYIIIAPKKAFGIKEKLKAILPVALIAAGAAGIIQLATKYSFGQTLTATQDAFSKSAAIERATDAMPMLSQAAPEQAAKTVTLFQNISIWFFAGALFALLIYFIIGLYRKSID